MQTESIETYLQLLKQRYADRNPLPSNLAVLSAENPDIPLSLLNQYLLEKGEEEAENYYIRNRILRGRDTDLMEFTYYMVSFEMDGMELFGHPFSYLASEEYSVGDMVVTKFGFSGWMLGKVTEVSHCLGIDAPWPVSQTKVILRKAQPEEIAFGEPCLTAEEQRQRIRPQDLGRNTMPPVVDWSDKVLAHEEVRKEGDIPGFLPAREGKFRRQSIADLREEDWVPCEFRFRGLLPEIAKLKRYARKNDIWISAERIVSDQVREMWVIADDKTMDLIEKFPALKATGLVEHWSRQQVYVMYSESGYSGVTKMEFGGYFDRRHDGGNGRWEWEYDMMAPVKARFTWLQTGEREYVSYRYPFAQDWNRDNYTREENGLIYVAKATESG